MGVFTLPADKVGRLRSSKVSWPLLDMTSDVNVKQDEAGKRKCRAYAE